MAQSKVAGSFKCKFCKTPFSTEAALSAHLDSKCRSLFKITRKCPYCQKSYTSSDLGNHLTKSHPNKDPVRFYPLPNREMTEKDALLKDHLQEVGHPGGASEHRDGFILCFNGKFRLAHYVYEYFGEPVPKPNSTRVKESWIGDALLELDQIMTNHYFECPEDWNLGHLGQWSLHQVTEEEKLANRLGSNCCYQHVRVNKLLLKLEGLIEGFPNNYYTHVLTGTKVGKDPKMWGKEEKRGETDGKIRKSKTLKAAVPEFILKIIILQCKTTMEWTYDAYLIPNNETCGSECAIYRESIDYINSVTGFNYLNAIKEKCKRVDIFKDVTVTKKTKIQKNDYRIKIKDPIPSTSSTSTRLSSIDPSLQTRYEALEKEHESLKMAYQTLEKLNKRVIADFEAYKKNCHKKRRIIEDDDLD